jgi:hypothetical protein
VKASKQETKQEKRISQQITHDFGDTEANESIASHFEGKKGQKQENKASATQKN